jgi:hypothetical protein
MANRNERFVVEYERRWRFPGRGDQIETQAWWEMIEGWNPDWFPELMDRVQAMRDTNQGFPRREVVEQAWRILVAQKSQEEISARDSGPLMSCREFLLWLEQNPDQLPEEGSKTVAAWRRRFGMDPGEEAPGGGPAAEAVDATFPFGHNAPEAPQPTGSPVPAPVAPEADDAEEDLFNAEEPSAAATEPRMPKARTGPLQDDEEIPW